MKNVSLLAIGGILGAMTIRGDANASIVSRNFLENALTDYAKTTALDLKANQSDLTALSNKIGTLPSGNFPEFPGYELLTNIDYPGTYPTSLAELISDIYGFSEYGTQGLLGFIIQGFPSDTNGDGSPDALVGLIPNFVLARNAKNLASTNATKIGTVPDGKNLAGMIGTLPAGYDSVGAALTAIKGIAEEAKAAAVAAIPDPKAEGSSGKYVLTVDIIGDNATYRWEKIDRSESESTTTE